MFDFSDWKRRKAKGIGRGFAKEGDVDGVEGRESDGEASVAGVLVVGDFVFHDVPGTRIPRDAAFFGFQRLGNNVEGRPNAFFVGRQGEHAEEALVLVEKRDVLFAFGPEEDFRFVRGTNAPAALQMNISFAAPEPVAPGDFIASCRADPISFFRLGWVNPHFITGFNIGFEIQSQDLGPLWSGGEEEEEKALHGEKGDADGEVIEPAGRAGGLCGGAGWLVSFPPNDDPDDESGDGEADAENGVPGFGMPLQQEVSRYHGKKEGHRSHFSEP